uniref:Ribosomal protein L16 n=1 Tax=Pharyngomonas kirbyi TaxID=63601 RepID=A0A1W6R258_9EUKA|nr:ribosomal protein L16 [Pharyngomonas kirbyi]ARO47981.1 ribosomal protein L16 [Pharyngomonas kirbyi]
MRTLRRKLQQSSKFKNKIHHLQSEMNTNCFYIKANSNGRLTARHLETVRILTNRKIKKLGGRLVIKISPNIPVTKKSTGVRMGKGKGAFKDFIFYAKTDQTLFEFRNTPKELFILVFKKIKHKLPIKIKISELYD